MAKVTNATDWLTTWGNNLNAKIGNFTAGVKRVSTAPGAAAAAKADKMRAGVNAALDSGKWQRNVSAVSLADWQSATATKGAANIPAGIAQAQKTKQASITKMLADTQTAVAAVANMPTDTLQQRIAKSAAYQLARAAAAAQG